MILPFLVDIVEVPEHLDRGNVRTGVVDNALAAVLDQILQQLQRLRGAVSSREREVYVTDADLVNLSPLACLLLHEARVDSGHDFIEVLARENQ